MKKRGTRFLTLSALIAALYCALTLLVAPISFPAVQFRLSEALTVLPAFLPAAIPGLTVGCLLSNLVGFFIGVNPIGLIDSVFGTAATLIAALLCFWIGKSKPAWVKLVFVPLPPVICNGLIIGAELTMLDGPFLFEAFWPLGLSVALGELVVCYLLGVPLMLLLMRKNTDGIPLYQRLFKF